jgi:hypothetical protein
MKQEEISFISLWKNMDIDEFITLATRCMRIYSQETCSERKRYNRVDVNAFLTIYSTKSKENVNITIRCPMNIFTSLGSLNRKSK